MKKPNINNFFKPTPKKLKKLAWSVKAFTGSASLTLILNDYKWMGIGAALLGAICDFTIELFTDSEEIDTNTAPEAKQQFPEEMK